MKLRNKKTGGLANILDDDQDFIRVYTDAGWHDYDSLAELNEEWEDYKPKEPRINDGDARDAVYSWASSLQIHQVRCNITTRGLGVEVTTFEAIGFHSEPRIEFTSLDADVENGGIYSIDELCGEEEE